MDTGYLLASGLALATFAVHTFVGGVHVARPLLADTSLPRASKWLNYYCWHVVTVSLLALSAGFAWAAIRPEQAVVGLALGVLVLVFSGLSAAVALRGGIRPWRFPSTTLFLLTGLAALLL